MICELAALPNGIIHLTSLQRLVMTSYGNVDRAKTRIIPIKMEVLPESLGHISSLQHLKIIAFQNLTSLPELGNLVSLQTLEVGHCPKLQSLPTSIQCLTNLQELKLKSLKNLASLPNSWRALVLLKCYLLKIVQSCLPFP